MTPTVIGAVAAHFGRDLARTMLKLPGIIEAARTAGVQLLVLPDATLGGYLADLRHPDPDALPPQVEIDGPELARVSAMCGDMVVCLGFTERSVEDGRVRVYNAAAALTGDGVVGRHRKVHQPLGESGVFDAGDRFAGFDTPVGRVGMLIDYDKTFPEAARALALDGAEVIACLSAWPASVTNRADQIRNDRQARLFDLYDCARAAENQLFVASANQTGIFGGLRFLGQAKVVDPSGDVIARTTVKGGMAVAQVDVSGQVAQARRALFHLRERKPHTYVSADDRATSTEPAGSLAPI